VSTPTRLVLLALAGALLTVAVGLPVVAASTDKAVADRPPDSQGPCRVSASILETGEIIDPAVASGIYEVPVEGTVQYAAAIDRPTPDASREITGSVVVDLPWPFGSVTAVTWDGTGTLVDRNGVHPYSIPWRYAPVGATATVVARYAEPGLSCSGELTVRIAGGFGDGLARPAALAATGLGAAGIALATRRRWRPVRDEHGRPTGRLQRRGRPLLGALAGFVFGAGAALVYLLWSVVSLSSPLLSVVPVLGLVGGAFAGWYGLWGDRPPRPTDPAVVHEVEVLV